MKEIKILSPAKINLFLEVLSRREDGYHEVETILQAIDIHDEVVLRERKEGIEIVCGKKGVPQGKENLAYRAAEIILKETNLNRGVEIEIKKKIPVAAGLGGGSSNAAAVLVGLEKLWNLKLNKRRLGVLAKGLGTDVPFFIEGGRALGKGRGDELTSLRGWEPLWLTVVVPDFEVSTAWVYQSLSLGLTRKSKRIKIIIDDLKTWSRRAHSPILYNGLEEVTEKEYPQVKRIKERLRALGGTALMSGSGPAVFGVFPDRQQAERAGTIIKEEFASPPEAGEPGIGKEEIYVAKTFSGGARVIEQKLKVQS